jgi:tetratricopeptide (TPR) repeat protein
MKLLPAICHALGSVQRKAALPGYLVMSLATGLLCPLAANAATDPLIDNLNQLIIENRYTEAYALATQNLREYEGEPEFDFLFGLAAMETGRPNEAVFAFERIVFIYPDQQRVKLELARALYQTNNLAGSRQLFTEVLATDPAPNVRTNIDAFLELIEERENSIAGDFTWFISSGIGSDSNINSATELGVISTPIGDVELSANGQSIEDEYFDIGTGMAYAKPLSKTSALNFSANYNLHNNFTTDAFDIDVLSGEFSYAKIVGNMRFSYGARAQRVDLDGARFQDSGSLITTFQRSPGDGWTQALTGAWTAVRFDDGLNGNAGLRDVNQVLLSGVLGKTMGNFFHSVSLYYGDEQAVQSLGKNNAQQFYGVAFSEQIQFLPEHVPYFRISLHRSDNKSSDPIFNVEREDQTFSTSLGWIWRANRNINVTTDVTYTENDSNIDLFEYDRVKYQTGLRYQF